MYIPGRLRTASSPSSTLIESAPYPTELCLFVIGKKCGTKTHPNIHQHNYSRPQRHPSKQSRCAGNTINQTLFHLRVFLKITHSLWDEFTVKNLSNPCSKGSSLMIHIKMVFDGDSPVQPGKRCHNARGPLWQPARGEAILIELVQ